MAQDRVPFEYRKYADYHIASQSGLTKKRLFFKVLLKGFLMDFEWNPQKADINSRKHGVSFEEASAVFGDTLSMTYSDPEYSVQEERYIIIGLSGENRADTLPPREMTLQPMAPEEIPVLEMDELWSFVFHNKNKVWVWIAMNRATREIVADACGDHSEDICRILWNRVPSDYKKAIVFSDYWNAYPSVIPHEQYYPVGKETGETAHIERWNNTLRQHLARFVRKTLSFSKCIKMHEICLQLFLHRYNIESLPSVGYDSI
ncbi:MAG: IS1 family transposase [Candidatus Thiosymbion ectosymbiont of Robbea hypermnestra]|nr:IS1 family transposase [Candidatus Thiosymbion ectosymbiont of Robbea hypermnestra]